MKYKFVTDASCDMPKELQEKYDITILPIEVRFDDEIFPNGLDNRDFYNKMTTTGIIPKTSMPNSYKFTEFYKSYANKDDVFIITIVISMEMSQTKLQAQMAADELGMKNVFIDESRSTTIGQGAIILELAKYCQKENDIEKIKAEYYRLCEKVRLVAVINDLNYLKQSGRLSGASAMIGGMLNIKPIVSIVDGKVVNVAKCVGNLKAETFIVESMKNIDTSRPLYLLHTDCEDRILNISNKYKDRLPSLEKIVCEIGCVVGSHVGAKCYGFAYFDA